MFCSQFVAAALKASGEIDIKKSPAIYHPVDFLNLEGIREVYRGRIRDLADYLKDNSRIE